jgi:hypothetical protein
MSVTEVHNASRDAATGRRPRHVTAPTQYVEAGGVRHAYRRFGKPGGTPLVFLDSAIPFQASSAKVTAEPAGVDPASTGLSSQSSTRPRRTEP